MASKDSPQVFSHVRQQVKAAGRARLRIMALCLAAEAELSTWRSVTGSGESRA